METGFALSEIDTATPHPARMYDALLGGKDNYAADRQAVRQLLEAAPEARDSARANRAFLQRAVRFLADEAGVRQFIDIGTGIPAAGNVHEVAMGARVAYVDNDRCKSGCAHATPRRSDCLSEGNRRAESLRPSLSAPQSTPQPERRETPLSERPGRPLVRAVSGQSGGRSGALTYPAPRRNVRPEERRLPEPISLRSPC
jgi:hypothetical protein